MSRQPDERRDPDRQAAEGRHDLHDPVERAAEVDETGEHATAERPWPASRHDAASADGDDERRERHPGERGMSELREAGGEEQARESG